MCGRARLPTDYSEIKIELKLDDYFPAPNIRPSWNIAPTQDMLAVVRDPDRGTRAPKLMRWGLTPAWSKELKLPYATFNARADKVENAPMFRGAWKAGRRCLVVTSGFYEWRKSDKQAFAIGCTEGLTVMAGLWETWRSDAETIDTCTIITTEPNELLAPIHNRMPVILSSDSCGAWLGEVGATADDLRALLAPYPADRMRAWEVGPAVGNVRNHGPELIEPVAT